MRIYPVWHYLHYTAWLLGVFQGVRLSTHSLDAAIYSNTATLWKTNLKQSWLPAFSVKGFVFFIKKKIEKNAYFNPTKTRANLREQWNSNCLFFSWCWNQSSVPFNLLGNVWLSKYLNLHTSSVRSFPSARRFSTFVKWWTFWWNLILYRRS